MAASHRLDAHHGSASPMGKGGFSKGGLASYGDPMQQFGGLLSLLQTCANYNGGSNWWHKGGGKGGGGGPTATGKGKADGAGKGGGALGNGSGMDGG